MGITIKLCMSIFLAFLVCHELKGHLRVKVTDLGNLL
jgi:hypothetical protein